MRTIQELQAAQRAAQQRMANAADNEAEFRAAQREFEQVTAELQVALATEQARRAQSGEGQNLREQFRSAVLENLRTGNMRELPLTRGVTSSVVSSGSTNNMASAGIPLTIGELVQPLELKSVYDLVGIRIATGVRGQLVWPVLSSAVEATVSGETVELADSSLNFDKITANPQRVGLSVKVSNEAINDSAFDLRGEVSNQLRMAITRLVNKAVTGMTAKGNLTGPFAGTNAKRGAITFAATYPTFQELLKMRGIIATKGVEMEGFCYIMNPTTLAMLESTPITTGDSRMIVNGGKIAGYPVFVTDTASCKNGQVNAGCFAYAVLNQHDDPSFIIDPYSKSKSNEVVFTLNARFSLTVLKHEAFCVGTPKTA